MGLILCTGKEVSHPLYISDMGIRVFSLEELCYVIFNYPLIAIDGLVNERLIDFVENDLRIRLPIQERYSRASLNCDEILLAVLNASDYYSASETDQLRQYISELRRQPRYELYRMKGDLLLELRQYGKALTYYEMSLNDAKDQHAEDLFYFRVCRSMGQTYANEYRLKDAFQCFKNALIYNNDDNVIKMIYYLSKIDDSIEHKQEYLKYAEGKDTAEWDNEYESIVQDSKESLPVKELEKLSGMDSVKLHLGLEKTLNDWKRKYRNML